MAQLGHISLAWLYLRENFILISKHICFYLDVSIDLSDPIVKVGP